MLKRIVMLMLVMLLALPACAEDGLPALPNIPLADEVRLNEAANAPGGTLAFTNPEDPLIWPMLPAEEDGFTCLTSANWGVGGSVSAVYVQVQAEVGDALSFCYKTSSELGCDLLQLKVNGEDVKAFSGETAWAQYAWPFAEPGTYEIAFVYSKDGVYDEGSDAAFIRQVQLLSGAEAEAVLAANPVWPLSDTRTLQVTTPGAREIIFDDPTFALTGLHGLARYYIVPADAADILLTLGPDDDPDVAVLNSVYDGALHRVTDGAAGAGYAFTVPLSDGAAYIQLIPARDCTMLELRAAVCFRSEAAADELLHAMQGSGYQVHGWRYLDQASCMLTVIDQHGEFLEGVTVSVLSADGVELLTSDAEGRITFAAADGNAYTVHIVGAPAGYAFDPDRAWTLDAENCEAILDLNRPEE